MLALVGLPGSGKSTVGKALARRVGVPFWDSDQVIEQTIGCPISEYFAREGEESFRDIEQQVLRDLIVQGPGILSTGGGAVLRTANRELLKSQTEAVYLRSTPESLVRRLRHDSTRPLLQVADPLQKLQELFAQRDRLYREVASLVVDTGRPSVSVLVRGILQHSSNRWRQPAAVKTH